jgi:hypothetical protein
VLHKSKLVREVSNYAIRYGRHNSFIGHNALFCMQRYKINIEDINLINAKHIIYNYFNEIADDNQYQTSCFVRELLLLRDNALVFSNNVNFSYVEIEQLINAVCTI